MRLAAMLPIAWLALATAARATDVQAVLAPLRHQIQTSDYRATGQLVEVDGKGNRIRSAVSVKGLWFAGAMHTLVQIDPPQGASPAARQDQRVSILMEMRPDGNDSIRIFRPHESAPTLLPFEKWNESLRGGAFSYEDLLEPQYFWPGQTILRSAVFGSHHCNVLSSTPSPADRTHYAQVQTWLDQTIDYPVFAEKTMKQRGVVKDFTYFGLRQSGGVWAATQVEAKIRGQSGSTFLIIKRGSTKAHLSVNDFRPGHIGRFEDRP